jgi:hypothetical protein
MNRFFRTTLAGLVSLATFHVHNSFASPVCDFDGDGMSEFLVVNLTEKGTYDWTTFDPRTGRVRIVAQDLGTGSSKLIPGNWVTSGQAVAAIVDPVGPNPRDRATWTLKSLDYLDGVAVSKSLGRSGDIIILGGDYDGNSITDSLILKKTTGKLGLRVNYFLASYNGNNLGKERLYKALGAPFRDSNFFFSPDGHADYLAVLKRTSAGARVLRLKPFTDAPQSFNLGKLPRGARGPMPLKQGNGQPDYLLFYVIRSGQTQLLVKDLRGHDIYAGSVPGTDGVVVGDYFTDRGWEIGVLNGDGVTVVNPQTRGTRLVTRPSGALVSCVSNQVIQ